MSNESIFLVTVLFVLSFVLISSLRDRRWLHASISLNLLLIGIFGAKLVTVFGNETNIGNIFYAGVFLAGQLLVERYGTNEGKKSIPLGFVSVLFFTVVGQLVILYEPSLGGESAAGAMRTLLTFVPRISAASLPAYVVSQTINIHVYGYILKKWEKALWFRSTVAILLGQAVDSIIFFSIAFIGVLPSSVLIAAMFGGFVTKVIVGLISIPILYIADRFKTDREVLEEESEAVLRSIGEGLIMADTEGRIVMVNKAFSGFMGWTAEEVVGKPMAQILRRQNEAKELVPYNQMSLARVLKGEQVVEIATADNSYFVRKDGTRFPVRITAAPVVVDKTIIGAVEVFSDVTEEKRFDKTRNDFLLLASHQLRTPLSGTRWIIETLQKGVAGTLNDKQKKYVDMLAVTNSHLIKLASDTLELIRLGNSQKPVEISEVALLPVCTEAAELLEGLIESKKIDLTISPDISKLSVATNAGMLRRIIESLLANAIDYSMPHEKIEISGLFEGNEVSLSVKDYGIGIPNTEQSKIFERFYRGSNAQVMKANGSGLGLSTCVMLAEKIGGILTFVSTEGHGSTFTINLPVAGPKKK